MTEQQNQEIHGIFKQNPKVFGYLRRIQNNALQLQHLIQRMQSTRNHIQQSVVPQIHDISQIKYLNQYSLIEKEGNMHSSNKWISKPRMSKQSINQTDIGDFGISLKYLPQSPNNRVSLDLKRIITKNTNIDKGISPKSTVTRKIGVGANKRQLSKINQHQREYTEALASEVTDNFYEVNKTSDNFRIKNSINRFAVHNKQKITQFKQSRVSYSSKGSSNHQPISILKRESKLQPPKKQQLNHNQNKSKFLDRSLQNDSHFQSQLSFKPKQNHNKISKQRVSSDKNLIQINPNQLISYLNKVKKMPNASWPSKQIFQFFHGICQFFTVLNQQQLIAKKYKNCIYFGQKNKKISQISKNQINFLTNALNYRYQGFLWYYSQKIYYGDFLQGKKDGQGVQIDLCGDKTIWKGIFTNGTKNGYFQVKSSSFLYTGNLKNGYFHGQGNLTKDEFEFKGNFRAGIKQGYGEQKINKGRYRNLTYKGQFYNNEFEGKGQLRGDNFYYKGQFKNNLQEGSGFQKNHQYQFSGQFKKGQKVGVGAFKYNDGRVVQGYFRHGKFIQSIKKQETKKNSKTNENQLIKINQSKQNPQRLDIRRGSQSVSIKAVPDIPDKYNHLYQKYVTNNELQALQQQNEENGGTIQHNNQGNHSHKPKQLYQKYRMKPSSMPMSIASYPTARKTSSMERQLNSDQQQPLFQKIVEF